MSQNPQTPSTPPSDDPLASLHRMSTTAGVASQEYVAINMAAIAALLLGLASAAVLIGNVLMAIPVAAVICGILALRQIGNSNGTQTGRAMALAGMVVAMAMVSTVVVRDVQARRAVAAEEDRIFARVDQLGQALTAKDYDRALSLFTDTFLEKKMITKADFSRLWERTLDPKLYGAIKSVKTNGRVLLAGETADGRAAQTMLVIEFADAKMPLRRELRLKKGDDGTWEILDIPEVFPDPQGQPQAPTMPSLPR